MNIFQFNEDTPEDVQECVRLAWISGEKLVYRLENALFVGYILPSDDWYPMISWDFYKESMRLNTESVVEIQDLESNCLFMKEEIF